MSLALKHKQLYASTAPSAATEQASPSTASKVYVADKFTQLKDNLPSVLAMLKSLSGNEEQIGRASWRERV